MLPLQSLFSKYSLALFLITLGSQEPGDAFAQTASPSQSEEQQQTPSVEEARLIDENAADDAIGSETPPVDAATPEDGDQSADPIAGLPEDPNVTAPALPRNIPQGYSPLQLEVSLNGEPSGYISAFYVGPDGRMATTRAELLELSIIAPGSGPDDEVVYLDEIPSASFTYDEELQKIDIHVSAASRTEQLIAMRPRKPAVDATTTTGMLLNYSLFSALNADYGLKDTTLTGLSSHLEARLFSKLGSLDISGIIATPDFAAANTTRLDTTYFFDDTKRMMEYRLGDVISGGMNWSRPVRLGGGQIRRNFAMRPDLVTMPLPEISGTAGVPSNLDVYIGGVHAYSGELREGPFRLDSLPMITNEGMARVVLTDALGREVASEGEFATSPDLLRPGLFEFSAESGYLRRNFGSKSFDYADYPVLLGSARVGMTNALTAEVHTELSEELQNGGVGFLTAVPRFGTLNAAIAASQYDGEAGLMAHASWEKHWGDLFVRLSTSRTFGNYQDLAALDSYHMTTTHEGDFPKAIDQVAFGYSWPDEDLSANVNFLHALTTTGKRDLILGGSVAKAFGAIQVSGGGFVNFSGDNDYGVNLGLSMPLGPVMTASSTVSQTSQGYELGANISKAHTDSQYSTSWGVTYDRLHQNRANGRGELRTPIGTANGELNLGEHGFGGSLGVSGSAVVTRNGVLLGRNIGETFAIVDTGVPGVRVMHENRFAGVTNRNGLLLVPNVVPYAENKFEIDLDSMPLTAEAPDVEQRIVPRGRTGVLVDFNVTGETKAAIVQLKTKDGEFVPLSSEVLVEGNPEPFIMGYDGEVYLTGLAEKNAVTVKLAQSECKTQFDFAGGTQEASYIGPLTCE